MFHMKNSVPRSLRLPPISKYPAFISNRNSGQRLRGRGSAIQGDQSSVRKWNTANGLTPLVPRRSIAKVTRQIGPFWQGAHIATCSGRRRSQERLEGVRASECTVPRPHLPRQVRCYSPPFGLRRLLHSLRIAALTSRCRQISIL
jgi:hypothetical protein